MRRCPVQGPAAPGSQKRLRQQLTETGTSIVTYTNFLNYMWQPVLRYIEHAATAEAAPVWTEALGMHHAALQQEMLGKVVGPGEILPIDEWVEVVRLALREIWK